MRLKRLENQYRVYMQPDEFETLIENSYNPRAAMVIRIGGRCGLRVSETMKVSLSDVRRANIDGDEEAFFLRVPEGKDTTGKRERGKYRSAWLPKPLLEEMLDYAADAEHVESMEDSLVGASKRTLQKDVTRSAELAAEATGNEDYGHITSHDLRAFFATDMLIRKSVNPQVVMEIGGWVDFKSVQPYLNAQFDDIIFEELSDEFA